jgi:hypothetical protein
MRCARVTAKAYRPYKQITRGGYGGYCTDQPVLKTADIRPGQHIRDGKSDGRDPVVAMIFFSPVSKGGGGLCDGRDDYLG